MPADIRQKHSRDHPGQRLPNIKKSPQNRRFMHYGWSIYILLTLSLYFAPAPIQTALSQAFSPSSINAIDQVLFTEKNKFLTPIAVFGKDQRQRLPKRYKNLDNQIGLLHNTKTNTLCTAFCVGPDLIATASHCLFSHRKKRRLHLSSFLFKLKTGRKSRSPYSRLAGTRSKQTRNYIIAGTSKLNRRPPIGAARDWAIVRLERPACKKGWLKAVNLPYHKLENAARKKKLFQIAYHMDYRNWQIAYSRSCTVKRNHGGLSWSNIKKHFSVPQSLILHRCDTGEASSGSPLLMDSKNGPLVVGINVGTYQQRELTLKNGRVVRRTKYKTIANTAVSSKAFYAKISLLRRANIIRHRSDLKKLQISLEEQGYYRGRIDGIYGVRTELAIKAYERRTNRPITGLATLAILAELDMNTTDPHSTETSADHQTRHITSAQRLEKQQAAEEKADTPISAIGYPYTLAPTNSPICFLIASRACCAFDPSGPPACAISGSPAAALSTKLRSIQPSPDQPHQIGWSNHWLRQPTSLPCPHP